MKMIELGDHAKVISGYAFKSDTFQESGIPIIKISNIGFGEVKLDKNNTQFVDEGWATNLDKKYHVVNEDILISLTGSHVNQPKSVVGRVALYKKDYISLLNQRAGKVIDIDEKYIHPRYLFYILNSKSVRMSIALMAHGAASQANVSPKNIETLKLLLPSLIEQSKIASILSSYDELIDTNRNQVIVLENMLEELFKEWFVRFRFPDWSNEDFMKGIPSEWSFLELSEVIEIVKGKSYTSEEIYDENIEDSNYFINLKSFHKYGGYRDSGLKHYTGKYSDAQKVSQGDIVMAVTDMTQDRAIVGRVARIPTLNGKFAIISLDTVKIVPKAYSENFMYCYLSYSSFSETVKEFANGANVLHLSPKQVLKQKVLLPPVELTKSFDTIVSPILDKVEALTEMNAQLELIKQQLLLRLLSGKLSIAELDIHYPPSMQTSNEAEEK